MKDKDYWQWAPPAVAMTVAVVSVLILGTDRASFGDAKDYTAAAISLLEGQPYPRQSSLPFFRPPLYPLLLSALWWFTGVSYLPVKIAQVLMFGATCWLLYRLAIHIGLGRRSSLMGALLYGLNPFAILPVTDVQTEPLQAFLVAWGVFALASNFGQETSLPRLFVGGLALGLAALCRPAALPVAFSMALVFAWIQGGSWQVRTRLRWMAVILAGVVLPICPWTFCNWAATGDPILISDGFGFHLWLGNHPDTLPLYEGSFANQHDFDALSYGHLMRDLPAKKIEEWNSGEGYSALSIQERDRRWRQEGWQEIRREPRLTGRLWIYKAWTFWRPWLRPAAYSDRMVLASGLVLGSIFVLAIVGSISLSGTACGSKFLWLLAAIFLTSTAVHVVTLAVMRYRLPYVDPYLCLLAGHGLVRLSERLMRPAPTSCG